MSRIKELRKKRGWTQEYLGQLLDVQKATISKYEKGVVVPSSEVLNKMADYFNVSTDYLLGRERSEPPLTGEQRALLAEYESLSAEGKSTLMKVLEGLRFRQMAQA